MCIYICVAVIAHLARGSYRSVLLQPMGLLSYPFPFPVINKYVCIYIYIYIMIIIIIISIYISIYIYIYVYTYIYIYIAYVSLTRSLLLSLRGWGGLADAANLRTKILDLGGFDSSRILISRGGIPRPTGNLPEGLGQAILVGIILVGRLGVVDNAPYSQFPTVQSEYTDPESWAFNFRKVIRRQWAYRWRNFRMVIFWDWAYIAGASSSRGTKRWDGADLVS